MSFVPDELLADAIAATGLDDVGDPHVLDGLRAYCAALTAAPLSPRGDAALRAQVTRSLATRLRVVAYAREHRAALDAEVVAAPLVVIGLFRAGTTFLSTLLDQDPATRSLLRWEAADPVPPVGPHEHRTGPRVDVMRAAAAAADAMNPALKRIHHEEADGPTECIAVMSQAFTSLLWESLASVPSYSEWLFAADHAPAYAYHHDVLRILQSGGVRGRWALKSPHHAISLDALVAEYPDATLVLLHRDPIVLCASVCSLIATLSGPFASDDPRPYIAAHWTNILDESIRRIDAFRAARPDVRILDVHYADLVREPLGTLEQIAHAAGRPLDDDARSAVQRHLAANPKGRFGAHRYDLASFGLDADELRARFAGYVERYEVASESPS